MLFKTMNESYKLFAKIEQQSNDLHAGTMPSVLIIFSEGFIPNMLFIAAGTLPEPAVSVPKLKLTKFEETETADPLELPPGISLLILLIGSFLS